MSESKHAKAPWYYVEKTNGGTGGVRNKGGFICFMSNVTSFDGQGQRYIDELQERIENAKLIARAPDILNELTAAIDALREVLPDLRAMHSLGILTGGEETINKIQTMVGGV